MPKAVKIELLKKDVYPPNLNKDLFQSDFRHSLGFVFNPKIRKAVLTLGIGLHEELTREAEKLTDFEFTPQLNLFHDELPSVTAHHNGTAISATGYYDKTTGTLELRQPSILSKKDEAGIALIIQTLALHGHLVNTCTISNSHGTRDLNDLEKLRQLSHSAIASLFKKRKSTHAI